MDCDHDHRYGLVLAGNPIYKMDYRPLIAYHVEHQADTRLYRSAPGTGGWRVSRRRGAGLAGRLLQSAVLPENTPTESYNTPGHDGWF